MSFPRKMLKKFVQRSRKVYGGKIKHNVFVPWKLLDRSVGGWAEVLLFGWRRRLVGLTRG